MPVKEVQTRPDNLARVGQIAVATVAATLLLIPVGCDRRAKSATEAPAQARQEAVDVTVAQVTVQPLQRSVAVTGSLLGQDEATISAKVPGRVVAINKDLGDRAAPGETLAQIEQTDYKLEQSQKEIAIQGILAKLGLTEIPPADYDPSKVPTVERARLQAENAKARFNRGKQLHDQTPPLISEQDYADLQTAYDVARSNYDVELLTAKALVADARTKAADVAVTAQKVADTTVRAPTTRPATTGPSSPDHDYGVAARMVTVGEYVREGAPLFRLVIDNPLKYRATVSEKYISEIKVGQQVELTVFAYPQTFSGTITRISPEVDPASRSFQIEAAIPNDRSLLKPGSFAKASILTRLDKDVTMVPRSAIFSFAGVSKVFTIKDGRAVEVIVDPGQMTASLVEIPGTKLQPLAQVITSNGDKLTTGLPVTIKSVPPTNTTSAQ